MSNVMQELKFVQGLVPLADRFAGTLSGAFVNVREYGHLTGVIYMGANSSGDTDVSVRKSSSVTGANSTAIDFWYKETSTSATSDIYSDLTLINSGSTFRTSVALTDQTYVIEVDTHGLGDYNYINIRAVENTNNANTGGLLYILSQPRFAGDDKRTVEGALS